MKIGDKLLCKKVDVSILGDMNFTTIGKYSTITMVNADNIYIETDLGHSLTYSKYPKCEINQVLPYIWDIFYTVIELRNNKLKTIIDV